MSHVGRISVRIVTGDINGASTNGKVYLGIGGREFRLDKLGDQFQRGDIDTFIIGDGSNIESNDFNTLPDNGNNNSPRIEFENLTNYPAYIRFEPQDNDDNWNIEDVNVQIIQYNDDPVSSTSNKKIFVDLEGNIWLGKRSGLFLHLDQFECYNPKITYDPSKLDLFSIGFTEYSNGAIKGDVYYPIDGPGLFPIVFIAHGNHGIFYNPSNRNQESCIQNPGWIEIPNYKGYDYFQKQLARMGIIAVSVDCNSTNCAAYGIINIEERADLIIGSIDHFRTLNADVTSFFNNKINFQLVGLVGHSRGGDAVVLVPERITFPDVNIKCVIALAPTDTGASSGQPNGYSFMTILPAGDGDVSRNDGAKFYDKAIPSPFKCQLYVHYTNHNFFNREWPNDDSLMGGADNPAVMSRLDHEQILSTYGVAFLRYILLNHNDPIRFLCKYSIPKYVHHENVQLSFQFNNSLIIDDHEDGNTINTNSLNLPTSQIGSIVADEYSFRQGAGSFNNSFYGNSTGMITTDAGINGTFGSTLPLNTNLIKKEIWLRTAEVYNMQSFLPPGGTGFQLGLEDNNGLRVWIDSDEVDTLARPYFRGISLTKTMPKTLRFSSLCYINKNSELNLSSIRSVFIRTNRGDNRALAFDDLAIMEILK
jgi:hypothetical protein